MNNKDNKLHEDVKKIADSASGDDLREKVRLVTLKALSQRQLDKESINDIVTTVIEGVTQGLGESSENLKPQLKASLSGIDDALSKSAIAAKLAAEEAFGRAEHFADNDLKKALNDFKGLESSFIETINSVAKGSTDLVSTALGEISEHFKKAGTASGKEAVDAVNSLSHALVDVGKGTVDEIASATQSAGGHFAKIASGILSGMADAVASSSSKSKT